ncbi:Uncharacterised protein [Bordetella pertussis]|nr:Uncharacterised protein [Bordetella pertussis]
MAADLRGPVIGHHLAVARVVIAAPVEMVPLEIDAETRGGRLQHAQPLGHDFLADAVAGDDGDPVFCCHLSLLVCDRARAAPARSRPALSIQTARAAKRGPSRRQAPLQASAFSLSL